MAAIINNTNVNYTLYYNLFITIFSIFFVLAFKFQINWIKYNRDVFSNAYSQIFLICFLVLIWIDTSLPELSLIKLIKPTEFYLSKDFLISNNTKLGNKGYVGLLTNYLILITTPFYYWALYCYRSRPILLSIFLFLPLYFYYAYSGYIGRSTIVPFLAIFLYTVYEFLPKMRRFIIVFCILGIVPSLVLLYSFAEARLGHEVPSVGIADAVSSVISTEFSFPSHFHDITKFTFVTQIKQYLIWLVSLPIPGFIKGDLVSLNVNVDFSVFILGIDSRRSDFYVFLPGLVNESIFIFGFYFFWIHAIVGGLLMGFLLKSISYNPSFFILQAYIVFYIVPLAARAGFFSAFPIMVNSFLFFLVFTFVSRLKI